MHFHFKIKPINEHFQLPKEKKRERENLLYVKALT